MITVGTFPSTLDTSMGYPYALAMASSATIGDKVGNYIYYKNYRAQITDKKRGKLCLVACGWVRRKDCRLKP